MLRVVPDCLQGTVNFIQGIRYQSSQASEETMYIVDPATASQATGGKFPND